MVGRTTVSTRVEVSLSAEVSVLETMFSVSVHETVEVSDLVIASVVVEVASGVSVSAALAPEIVENELFEVDEGEIVVDELKFDEVPSIASFFGADSAIEIAEGEIEIDLGVASLIVNISPLKLAV